MVGLFDDSFIVVVHDPSDKNDHQSANFALDLPRMPRVARTGMCTVASSVQHTQTRTQQHHTEADGQTDGERMTNDDDAPHFQIEEGNNTHFAANTHTSTDPRTL